MQLIVLNPNLKSLANVLVKITVRRLVVDRATKVQEDCDDEVYKHTEVADVAGNRSRRATAVKISPDCSGSGMSKATFITSKKSAVASTTADLISFQPIRGKNDEEAHYTPNAKPPKR